LDLRAGVEPVETAVQASIIRTAIQISSIEVDVATVLAVVVDLEEEVDVVVL